MFEAELEMILFPGCMYGCTDVLVATVSVLPISNKRNMQYIIYSSRMDTKMVSITGSIVIFGGHVTHLHYTMDSLKNLKSCPLAIYYIVNLAFFYNRFKGPKTMQEIARAAPCARKRKVTAG